VVLSLVDLVPLGLVEHDSTLLFLQISADSLKERKSTYVMEEKKKLFLYLFLLLSRSSVAYSYVFQSTYKYA